MRSYVYRPIEKDHISFVRGRQSLVRRILRTIWFHIRQGVINLTR
jgi:hypothetical protein